MGLDQSLLAAKVIKEEPFIWGDTWKTYSDPLELGYWRNHLEIHAALNHRDKEDPVTLEDLTRLQDIAIHDPEIRERTMKAIWEAKKLMAEGYIVFYQGG